MDAKNDHLFSMDWFDATGRMKESSHPWLDSLPLCLLVINQEYRIVGYNKQAGKIFHNPPKLVNHDVCKLCYVETDIPILRNFIDAGLRQSLSLVIKGRYKEPLHVKIHATRVDTNNWFVFIEDNTETFLLEEEARNMRSAINFAADAIYLFDEQGLIFFTNPAFERQVGMKAEEIVGKTIQEFWVSTEYEHLWSDIRAGKTWAGEMQCSRAYGCIFDVEILVRPIVTESRSFNAYVCVQRDITKRKAMEKQLAEYSHDLEERVKQRTESLAKLHDISQLFHSAETLEKRLHLILIATTAGEAFGFNRAFLLLYHEDSHSLVGQMAIGPSSPEEAGHIWKNVAEIPDDGTFMGRMKSYLDHAGRMDENANRIARQMYIPLSDTFSILAQAIELDRSFIVNHGQAEVEYDLSIMELLGTDTFAVIPLIARENKIGALVVDNIITQKSIEPEDLQMVDILANQAALAIAHANTLDELARKVEETEYAYSELRRSQEKLIESSKFAALGQMAATVAHEIRTPLVTIGGFANLLKSQMEGYREQENLHYIDIIREEAFRLEDVLNQLLFYARPSRPKLAYHDLHAFIDSILNFLKKEFSKNQIQLVRHYDSQLPRVPFDSNLLRQVIINIVQNGIQSMSKDGKLWISTSREKASLVVGIQDEGVGISADLLSRIFEPFYSTKHAGTGLGLHVSKRIVESHNGTLTIESQIGVGTSVCIRLPIKETRTDEKNSRH